MILVDILRIVLTGNIPFWYDPARDFLLAKENLNNFTLVGPTTGIPGLLYGPYWIWILSLALVITSDPKIVTFIILTIPYLIILPAIFYLFYKKIGSSILLTSFYFLFMFNFGQFYSTQLWNPNLAPLLFLLFIYLIVFLDYSKLNRITFLKLLISGFILGIILNIHASFGIAVLPGALFYVLVRLILSKNNSFYNIKNYLNKFNFISLLTFSFGIIVSFLPFIIFEIRHNFIQVKSFINAFTNPEGVININGLSKIEIVNAFIDRITGLIQINHIFLYIFFLILLLFIFRKKVNVNYNFKMLLLFVLINSLSLIIVYLNADNPVWAYHFVAVEILGLLLFITSFSLFKHSQWLVLIWTILLAILNVNNVINGFNSDPLESGSLAAKTEHVNIVYNDIGKNDFSVFVFSPSIYIYDYSYLFQYMGSKKLSYRPELEQLKDITYVIIPKDTKESDKLDFINYRTPNINYQTTKTWKTKDGTLILKRIKK